MLLKCEYTFSNRLAPGQEAKKCHATFILGKKQFQGKEEVYFTVNTAKGATGQKFLIKNNLVCVHNSYVSDGKCTISLKDPPYDFIIAKAPVDTLKKFLLVIKLVVQGKDTSPIDNILPETLARNIDLKKPKLTLSVLSKDQYPIRHSFPSTLQSLIINHCLLKKFDDRILKLNSLVTLDLSFNKLVNLCETMENLVSLKCVHLQNNKFESIPSCLLKGNMAAQIKLLDLSSNEIKFLPGKINALKEIVTLKLSCNKISFLPSNLGHLSKLQFLHLNNNQLTLLPRSFQQLRLSSLDMSGNLFGGAIQLNFNKQLDDVPSLKEVVARYIAKRKINYDMLPRRIQSQLEDLKYCPCGNPCFINCVPYIKKFDVGLVSHTVSYDNVSCQPYIVGYLCSKICHSKWLANPNTLFTKKIS